MVKSVEKSGEKILALIKVNTRVTQKELIHQTGLTRRGVEWNIAKLKKEKIIKRIGPDKGACPPVLWRGHWEVVKG